MAPLIQGGYRRCIRYGCAVAGVVLAALAWGGTTVAAAPKFTSPITQHVDAGATVALPRSWGPLRLTSEAPVPAVPATINSPFGPSRLVFAQQAPPRDGFGLVTIRKSDFEKGSPQYLETLRARDLAILLTHMESRVHGDRPVWAARLVHGKPPAPRMVAGRRLIYWEGEWMTANHQTAVVRGYAFFGNGAVYLLRVLGRAAHNPPEFAEEARFADMVAATFRAK